MYKIFIQLDNDQNWRLAYVSIKSITDFHIEITGFTGNDSKCFIALDDVELNILENCKSKFQMKLNCFLI